MQRTNKVICFICLISLLAQNSIMAVGGGHIDKIDSRVVSMRSGKMLDPGRYVDGAIEDDAAATLHSGDYAQYIVKLFLSRKCNKEEFLKALDKLWCERILTEGNLKEILDKLSDDTYDDFELFKSKRIPPRVLTIMQSTQYKYTPEVIDSRCMQKVYKSKTEAIKFNYECVCGFINAYIDEYLDCLKGQPIEKVEEYFENFEEQMKESCANRIENIDLLLKLFNMAKESFLNMHPVEFFYAMRTMPKYNDEQLGDILFCLQQKQWLKILEAGVSYDEKAAYEYLFLVMSKIMLEKAYDNVSFYKDKLTQIIHRINFNSLNVDIIKTMYMFINEKSRDSAPKTSLFRLSCESGGSLLDVLKSRSETQTSAVAYLNDFESNCTICYQAISTIQKHLS